MMLQLGDDGVVSSVNEEELIYVDKNELKQFIDNYHELEKENEQLKLQLKDCEQKKQNIKELLICSEAVVEQKKLQKLIYGQIIALIDDKILEYKKYDGYDTEKYYIGTQLLKELKKELKGDDVE